MSGSTGKADKTDKKVNVGDRGVPDELVKKVYDELRELAARYLRHERPDHTLQPTALVHEVFLRLAGRPDAVGKDRTQFIATAPRAWPRRELSKGDTR